MPFKTKEELEAEKLATAEAKAEAKADKAEEKADKKEHKSGAEAVVVVSKDGGFVREYSRKDHGEDFVKLAEGFAGAEKNTAKGYTVKKLK